MLKDADYNLIAQRQDALENALLDIEPGAEIELANGMRVERWPAPIQKTFVVRSHFVGDTYRTAVCGARSAAFCALTGNAHTDYLHNIGVRAQTALLLNVVIGH